VFLRHDHVRLPGVATADGDGRDHHIGIGQDVRAVHTRLHLDLCPLLLYHPLNEALCHCEGLFVYVHQADGPLGVQTRAEKIGHESHGE